MRRRDTGRSRSWLAARGRGRRELRFEAARHLPADSFEGLRALETLELGNNRLASLASGVFDGLDALEALALQGNPGSPLPLTNRQHPRSPDSFDSAPARGGTMIKPALSRLSRLCCSGGAHGALR